MVSLKLQVWIHVSSSGMVARGRKAKHIDHYIGPGTITSHLGTRSVVVTIKDVQPYLLKNYTGRNINVQSLICTNCKLFAVEPKECAECHEVLCEVCLNDPLQKKCKTC